MITLGIVAIVLSVAVPGFNNTIKDNRLAVSLNNIVTDIHFARSEAVKRDTRVIMCRSANPNAAEPSCGGTAKFWTDGYLIFADDGNYTNDDYDAGTDVLLRRGQEAATGINFRTNATWNEDLEFNPNGTTNETDFAQMSICDDRGKEKGRSVTVATTGIPIMKAGDIGDCYP
jgi:type IV fimbrial biogenesis protein FimT